MRLLIGLTILVTLALLASSQRFYRFRRTRLGAALTTGGWLMVAIGFAIGPYGAKLLLPQQLMEVEPLILFCLGWVGLMVGLQAHRTLPRAVPGGVFALVGVDLLLSVGLLGAVGLGVMVVLDVPWTLAMPVCLLLGVMGSGWSAEVRSLQRRVNDPANVMSTIRAGAGLSSLAAVVAFGLLFKSYEYNPATGVNWSAQAMAVGLFVSVMIGLAMGLVGQWLMALAGRGEGEFLVVLLGVVVFTAGAAATLGYSALLVAALAGAVVVNMPGKPLQKFQRVIVDAEQPVAMALMLVAGVLADPRLGAVGVALIVALVLVRSGVKYIMRTVIRRYKDLNRPTPALLGLIRQNPLAIAMAAGYAISPAGQSPTAPITGGQLMMIVIVMGLLAETFALIFRGPDHEAADPEAPTATQEAGA